MQGQAHHFNRFATEDIPYGKQRECLSQTAVVWAICNEHTVMIVTTYRLHRGDEASLQRARDPAAGQRLAGRSRTGDVFHRGYERDPLGEAPSIRCDSFARSLAAREGELWDCFSQNHSREERVLIAFAGVG